MKPDNGPSRLPQRLAIPQGLRSLEGAKAEVRGQRARFRGDGPLMRGFCGDLKKASVTRIALVQLAGRVVSLVLREVCLKTREEPLSTLACAQGGGCAVTAPERRAVMRLRAAA